MRLPDGSGMNREVHVPFCKRPQGKFLRSTYHECFNTLKNQGYHLTHNYGHGEKHLAFNFYLLTLLAFTLHQIAELCDIAFKTCRQIAGSKRSLWEKFRTIINIAVFESLEQFFNYFLDREAYNFIDGYAVKRPPP